MTTTQPPATDSDTDKARPRKTRDEGQWALGQTEPLNHNEEFKAADNPLNVRERILDVYSKQGFDSIHPDVVCSVHLGAILGIYESRSEPTDGIRVVPFAGPGYCLTTLPVAASDED